MQPHRAMSPLLSIAILTVGLLISGHAWGQSSRASRASRASKAKVDQTYRVPPAALMRLVDRPPTPAVSLNPDNRWLLVMERPSLPHISELAQPELGLAGRRINPANNGPSRMSYISGLRIKDIQTRKERKVRGLPKRARMAWPRWSPDGQQLAFFVVGERGIALYTANVATARARRLSDYNLNGATGSPCKWMPASDGLLCKIIPGKRRSPPRESPAPKGPVIQESTGEKAPAPTYQNLLENRHDEALFDHYFTSELVEISTDGEERGLKIRGIIANAEPSPSGEYLLVETVRRPYSYLVPMSRFPWRVEVYNRKGKLVRRMADLPLAENVPIGFDSARIGRREFGWRADAPATLYFSEARDQGDMKSQVAVHDRVLVQSAPFRGEPQALVDLAFRYSEIQWGHDSLALISDWRWKDRRYRVLVIDPSRPGHKPRVLFDRSWEDRYGDPGEPEMRRTPQGTQVLETADNGKSLFLSGAGASPEGDRPFIDKLEVATGKTHRLWRSRAPHYERPIRFVGDGGARVLTRRESRTDPPQYVIRDLKAGTLDTLTRFPHPHPEFAGMSKELIKYKRADGLDLNATLYLPPGYDARKGPLPLLMWAYPTEYKSKSAAGQVRDSPYRFDRISGRSSLIWLLRGYAVLDDPSMPIVGEGDAEPNDRYVEQLVSSAKAAIDEVVRRGVADRDHIAIGGHSYGAFMAANLLAHSDLFRAGIARSGAYNRTLTPFGFQSEERTFWQASRTYFAMSPFMHADKIDEPMLMIHGEADSNTGTYPMQSKRMYQALKGLGGKVRLVMLPHESHGYRARESIMHMLWETDRWLEMHVRSPREDNRARSAAGGTGVGSVTGRGGR